MRFQFAQPSVPRPSEILPGRSEPVAATGQHALLGRPLAGPYPVGLEVAEVGMGCFWGAEKRFWGLPGVWVTAVGYEGGTTPNPTYPEVCTGRTGHAEAVRIVFDPSVIPFEQILRTFWEAHDPTQGYRQGNDVGTQYRSVVFARGAEQLAVAMRSREVYAHELARAGFGAITTEIVEAATFYFAEDYHQGYLVKNPDGYDCHAATGVACPVGLGVPSAGGEVGHPA